MRANDQIFARMRSHGTLLCVGLDPDRHKLPIEVLEKPGTDEEKVFDFLQGVIDATGAYVCAYKAQKAFFDLLPGGHDVLKEIVHYVHQKQPGVPIIIDCKIGDIYNTMEAYIENLFGSIQADGIVVNPYMGDDVIVPLIKLADKAIVVLVKTSNASGSIVQDIVLSDGRLLWQYLLDLLVNHWNKNDNMIPVLSSISGLDVMKTRLLIPNTMPILLAGVGAQGGNYDDLPNLLNSEGVGVFVNSSRNILYPASSEPWRAAIATAAVEMKETLNQAGRTL
ncbi:MAG: orotidine-5'-phosphate decarboxylase [Parcubacteria group bacterium]|nr:orotidine-5'-phosphate decarboxylase [Parcubacteria group bacterium]